VDLPALKGCCVDCSGASFSCVLLILWSTSSTSVSNNNDVKLMGLKDLGLVISFFPVSGMNTTLALLHALGICPNAKLLIITFLRMGRSFL